VGFFELLSFLPKILFSFVSGNKFSTGPKKAQHVLFLNGGDNL